jgi:hypothetical protein
MVSDFYAPEPVKPANHLPSPEASEGRLEFTRIELGFFYPKPDERVRFGVGSR